MGTEIGIVDVLLSSAFLIVGLLVGAHLKAKSSRNLIRDLRGKLVTHASEIARMQIEHHEEITRLQADLKEALARVRILEAINALPKGMKWVALFLRNKEATQLLRLD